MFFWFAFSALQFDIILATFFHKTFCYYVHKLYSLPFLCYFFFQIYHIFQLKKWSMMCYIKPNFKNLLFKTKKSLFKNIFTRILPLVYYTKYFWILQPSKWGSQIEKARQIFFKSEKNVICDWHLQGDSGSSLQLSVEINRWVQVGLVSFGAATGCVNDHPNGYSKISYYLDWIGTMTGMNFDWGNFSNWNLFVIFCICTILCFEFNLVMDWIPKNYLFNSSEIYLVWTL